MARRHDSESSDGSPAERRSRYDRRPSSRSKYRRNDSSDSDRGRQETGRERPRQRNESYRVDRRGRAQQSSDSGREEDSRRVERKKGSARNRSQERGERQEDKSQVQLPKDEGEVRYQKRSEREASGKARGEQQKREDSPVVSDGGERDSDKEIRKQKPHVDEEDEELVPESRKRDRRHRNGHRERKHGHESSEEDGKMRRRNGHRERKHGHGSSEDDERNRRGKERNEKSRNDYRRREDHDHGKRGDRHRSPRRNREREEKEDRPESTEKQSHRKIDEDEKAQKPSTAAETNPAGDVATLGRTGGVYIPPFKLARMMKEVEDKSSPEYQRLTWDALRKSINGLVNKVNATNIKNIIPELFSENLIRGRGVFCRAVMKSQFASPGFTDVFAALVAVVNTKIPQIGDLLLRRIVLQLRRAYRRNDKPQLLAAVKFVAHLVNQHVAYELIALELLTILLDQPTDDSVEVAVGFVTECGAILQDLSPKGLHGIFERFRGILHEGEIDKRVQFLIEGLFAIRKAKFQGYPAVRPELDLVEPEDQLTHEISIIDEDIDQEISLDIFRPDPDYLENEKKYEVLKKSILGDESEEDEDSDGGSDSDDEDGDDEEDDEDDEEQMEINDQTETNLVNLRRTIYLTIMSSVDFEEAGHKLLKIKLEPGQEMELCIMLLECCSQERTYLRYYGLLGQRFCMINKIHQDNFEKCFVQQYSMIHRLETNKLRNVAKFFAHLLGTDALPWHVLSYIRLTEEDTTSSSRIFIKILFQELSEHLGIRLLNERLNDPTMQDSFESIFPRDNPRNTRFAINFFTSIGLGGITENLREYLKNMPRIIMQQQQEISEDGESESESGSSSGSDSSSSESESSSSSSEESDREKRRKRRR